MSEKKIAASTSCRRTGCRVISLASAGSRQASSIAVPTRASRYSGSDRPACRMNHTGRRVGPLAGIGAHQRRIRRAAVDEGVRGEEGSRARLCRTIVEMINSGRGAAVPRCQPPRPRPRCAGTSLVGRAGRRVRARGASAAVRVRCRRPGDVQPVRAVPGGRRRRRHPAPPAPPPREAVAGRSGYTADAGRRPPAASAPAPTPPRTCSPSPAGSTRWSSASGRSPGRSAAR